MQRITILGATGSIGVSTLDVLARHPDRYAVYALTAHSRVEELAAQCRQFRPATRRASAAPRRARSNWRALLRAACRPTSPWRGGAVRGRVAAATSTPCMAAIVGAAGLAPTLAAARAGKKILLANKEALVMSGQLFMDAVREQRRDAAADRQRAQRDLPVPARATMRATRRPPACAKILLTASGGPFLARAVETLDSVTPDEACAHPNWVDGPQDLGRLRHHDEQGPGSDRGALAVRRAGRPDRGRDPPAKRDPLDGRRTSTARCWPQLGNPDMRTPIAHALAYPGADRRPASPQLDLDQHGRAAVRQRRTSRASPAWRWPIDALRRGRHRAGRC